MRRWRSVDWQSAYQTNSEKVLEITRRYFAEVTKIQTEMAHLTREQVVATHKNAVRNFGDLAKATVEETAKAVKATENRIKEKRAP